jgi:hypothetical protein
MAMSDISEGARGGCQAEIKAKLFPLKISREKQSLDD